MTEKNTIFFSEELRVAAIALKEHDEKDHELQLANIEVQYSLEGNEKAAYPVIVSSTAGSSSVKMRLIKTFWFFVKYFP